MVNRRAWIRIVEASIAILLLAGITLLILNQWNLQIKEDSGEEIYGIQKEILHSIQTDNDLREDVLNTQESNLPISWNNVPDSIKTEIQEKSSSLNCQAKICGLTGECVLQNPEEKNIYSEFIVLTVTTSQSGDYSPRKLKLFCWENE